MRAPRRWRPRSTPLTLPDAPASLRPLPRRTAPRPMSPNPVLTRHPCPRVRRLYFVGLRGAALCRRRRRGDQGRGPRRGRHGPPPRPVPRWQARPGGERPLSLSQLGQARHHPRSRQPRGGAAVPRPGQAGRRRAAQSLAPRPRGAGAHLRGSSEGQPLDRHDVRHGVRAGRAVQPLQDARHQRQRRGRGRPPHRRPRALPAEHAVRAAPTSGRGSMARRPRCSRSWCAAARAGGSTSTSPARSA